MQLNLHTDYGLRILMALAASGERMSVDSIARRYGVSRNHMAKIAQRLQALGLVAATRGRAGGLELARPAKDINIGAAVRALENLDGFVQCLKPDGPGGCAIDGVCGLKGALVSALEAFLAQLDRFTLADLVRDRRKFMDRLALPAAA
ncbi:Rrf2 family transcriptional regulator [Parasphingopyxis marina]|uniref:Rrf2 family transcriptional regulator n=1 Tax=Parasphingopyxis marina TaxID=2761622 RepID=A0A842HVQ9_9SPHN|nr:Rrf2 family transcriptional regulator [Parasphingopyxis marina]MBC2776583.1 Rrf2 family transcriptional regulator [Parasphingopyxis marina]